MRQVGISEPSQEIQALRKYDHLREQGLNHSEAVEHAAIYYGVLNSRIEELLARRRRGGFAPNHG